MISEQTQNPNNNTRRGALLGAGIQAAIETMREQHVSGINQVILAMSKDGQIGDSVSPGILPPGYNFVGISVETPKTDLLRTLAGGSATRVLHFANWSGKGVGEQFSRWLAYAVCDSVIDGEKRRQLTQQQQQQQQQQITTTLKPTTKKIQQITGKSHSNALFTTIFTTTTIQPPTSKVAAPAVGWQPTMTQNPIKQHQEQQSENMIKEGGGRKFDDAIKCPSGFAFDGTQCVGKKHFLKFTLLCNVFQLNMQRKKLGKKHFLTNFAYFAIHSQISTSAVC
jgi:hypothetical protein